MERQASSVDWVLHRIFRVGYALQLMWWRVRHPSLQGAAVAVWYDGQILVIRNSYRRSLTFPAGSLGRFEDHRSAAARELREEVGISVPPQCLEYVGEYVDVTVYADDHLHLYVLVCRERPEIRVDGREVVHAEFLTPAEALEGGTVGAFRSYLRGVVRDGAGAGPC